MFLFIAEESILNTHGSSGLHSGNVFGGPTATPFLDDCNPSTVIETRSPVDVSSFKFLQIVLFVPVSNIRRDCRFKFFVVAKKSRNLLLPNSLSERQANALPGLCYPTR